MQLAKNQFLRAIQNGEKQVGLWVSMCSPYAAEVVAGAGFDWVVVDMEHAPNDVMSVAAQLQAFAGTATTTLVRPDWNDKVAIKRVLDVGAQGLVIPMVQSVAEAEQAVAATRYPPSGVRGVAGAMRATKFGRIADYAARVSDETALILQVETMAAIQQAEAIGGLDGVSGVFFGPADIAADLGHVGQPMHPDVWAVIKPAARRLIDQGVPVGTLVLDPAFATALFNEGFSFVACGLDTTLLAQGADALLQTVKSGIE